MPELRATAITREPAAPAVGLPSHRDNHATLGLKAEGRPAWMVAPLGFESSERLALRAEQKPKKQKRHFRTEKALG